MKLTTVLLFIAMMLLTTIISVVYASPTPTEKIKTCVCKVGIQSHDFSVIDEVKTGEEEVYISLKPHTRDLKIVLTDSSGSVLSEGKQYSNNCHSFKTDLINQNVTINVLANEHVLEVFFLKQK